jgi:hypothetical protein
MVVCEWHAADFSRLFGVQKVFRDAGFTPQEVHDAGLMTDGNLGDVIVPPAIRGCKNEKGCALFEAIGHYSKFLIKQPYRRGTCFPCILMLDVGRLAYLFVSPKALYYRPGSCLAFYGCLWTGLQIVVEPLTPGYNLTTHWSDEAGHLSIAAGLSAFMNTVRRLEAHYLRVPGLPPRKGTFPYPTSYTDDETGQQINFEYETRVLEKHRSLRCEIRKMIFGRSS